MPRISSARAVDTGQDQRDAGAPLATGERPPSTLMAVPVM